MKCPYNRKSLQYIRQTTYDHLEETMVVKSQQEVVKENYEMMECLKEECGAWVEGKCNYYIDRG